ncbi:MAG TPA: LysM peptidoglycan-binding domain-containing protein [Chitinophagaceae bacterium]|nr:LysM peptidoglycan-binding domain-containing protein [Chitinophagaceae bacterium]
MRKLLFLALIFSVHSAGAQKNELIIKSSDKGLYLDHKVIAKETYYSLGRFYNLHPRSIASFNNLDMNKGLNIDQRIRIPLLDTNFTQKNNTGIPVYYKVGDNEGLMTVSRKNKDVLLVNLRSWNHLSSDELKKDSKIIVGFLYNATSGVAVLPEKVKNADPVVNAGEKKDPPPAEEITKKEVEKIAKAEIKEEKKEEKKNPPSVVKEIRKPSIEGQGYFKNNFEKQVKASPASKDETVTSGIFKTLSGWEDGKYYLLIDKVAPGTIIKVINPTNNKAVYAKVLGEMSGIRQNEGYNIRISNAAASALEIAEQDKFIVKVNY